MKKYPAAHWERLGRWVYEARHQAGYSDTKDWAAAAKRSSRMLLGLERGEPVGAGTRQAVADALHVAPWSVFARLQDPESMNNIADMTFEEVQKLRDAYTEETGEAVPEWPEPLMRGIRELTNEELLAEVSRRMGGGAQEFPRDIGPTADPGSVSEPAARTDHLRAAYHEKSSISGEQEGDEHA